jgi:hypothetical protein
MGWLSLVVLLDALSDIACRADGHAVSRVAQLAGQACSQLLLGVCGKGRYQRAIGCSQQRRGRRLGRLPGRIKFHCLDAHAVKASCLQQIAQVSDTETVTIRVECPRVRLSQACLPQCFVHRPEQAQRVLGGPGG